MKKWIKISVTAIAFIAITVALFLVGFKADVIQPIVEQAGIWGYLIYFIFQVIITTVFCFVPATTFSFTLLGVNIFGLVPGLIMSIVGCWVSSMAMFLVGKYGGVKLIDWMIGKEDREKTQKLVSGRAPVLIPAMLAFPFFPDDALCMIAGMTKMNFWYFSIAALFTRSIGITGTALLGNGGTLAYVKEALGDNIVLWAMLVNIVLIDVWFVWKFSGFVEKVVNKIKERRAKKKEEVENKEIPVEEVKEEEKAITKKTTKKNKEE